MPIVDADRHTVEPIDMWSRRLPERFREAAPYFLHRDRPPPEIMWRGKPLLREHHEDARDQERAGLAERADHWAAGGSARAHLAAMDRDGIDLAYLFPTWTSYLLAVDEMPADLAAAFASTYNDWLFELCRADPHRLRPVGVVPRHDVDDMIDEAERVAALGASVIVLRPNPVAGRTLGDPSMQPFWEAVQSLDLAVALHEGSHARTATVGYDRFHTRFALHTCSHPMEHMMALVSLIDGHVLARHPGLRFVLLEAGVSWLPYWYWRLDEEHGQHRGRGSVLPSELLRRQVWAALEPGEPLLLATAEAIGTDRLVVGTDFPHFDHDVGLLQRLRESGHEAEFLRAVTGHNPLAAYEGPNRFSSST